MEERRAALVRERPKGDAKGFSRFGAEISSTHAYTDRREKQHDRRFGGQTFSLLYVSQLLVRCLSAYDSLPGSRVSATW